jgi:ABC-type multidrug transport system ATPase subunit
MATTNFCPEGYFAVAIGSFECKRDPAYWAEEETFYVLRNVFVLGVVPILVYLVKKGYLTMVKPVSVIDRIKTIETALHSQTGLHDRHRSSLVNKHEPYQPVNFKFKKLSLEVKGKTVLKGITGEIKSSSMVAIMGPSGAGKSSFLNVLCGRAFYGKVHGQTLINGFREDIIAHRDRMGFVPQDDVVHDDLTVRENLWYSALLRMPGKSTQAEKQEIVDEALRDLHLERIANSIVGSVENRGVSGGERKRVNIGLELCADPRLLFLDEPTSGLDSTSSERVVKALRHMARKKTMTIMLVIHQPRFSIFTRFDEVILLGRRGMVYHGPPLDALAHFERFGFKPTFNENPADFVLDVISGGHGEHEVFDKMLSDTWQSVSTRNISQTRKSFLLNKHGPETIKARGRSGMGGALKHADRSNTSRYDLMLVASWENKEEELVEAEAASIITRFMRYALSVKRGEFSSYFQAITQNAFGDVHNNRRALFRPSQVSVIEEMLKKADSNNSNDLELSEFPGFVRDLETFLDGDQLEELLKWLQMRKPAPDDDPEETRPIPNEEFKRFLMTAKEAIDERDESKTEVGMTLLYACH